MWWLQSYLCRTVLVSTKLMRPTVSLFTASLDIIFSLLTPLRSHRRPSFCIGLEYESNSAPKLLILGYWWCHGTMHRQALSLDRKKIYLIFIFILCFIKYSICIPLHFKGSPSSSPSIVDKQRIHAHTPRIWNRELSYPCPRMSKS